MSVRVRFAPSPTGRLHIGNLRDAVYKFLMSRHEPGGKNVLRIEDTDQNRYSEDAEHYLMETLAWVGVEFDEGPHVGGPHAPYRQSARKEAGIYARWIQVLLDSGDAYKAFDTPEELEAMRKVQEANKLPLGYFGGTWRDATPEQIAEADATGKRHVIRQRIPRDTVIAINDAIRGRIEWDSNTVDDPVLIKADGMPTYHFAAMVDDHLMGITHIMRGEEWISSAPKHAALFDAFGWERPIFVHCPVIKGKSGKKLSKRDGDVSALDYREKGYLPGAIVNFIALIGWSPGSEAEIMTREEMIASFTIEGIQPSPGVFDLDKLRWMNGSYIRALSADDLVAGVREFVKRPETWSYWEACEPEEGQPEPSEVRAGLGLLREALEKDASTATQAILLEQQRVVTLADFGPACAFFFQAEPPLDAKAVAKWFGLDHVRSLFEALISTFGSWSGPLTAEDCERLIRDQAAALGLEKLGPVVHPLRVALTGRTAGPGLFELMAVLGPERMSARLSRALQHVP